MAPLMCGTSMLAEELQSDGVREDFRFAGPKTRLFSRPAKISIHCACCVPRRRALAHTNPLDLIMEKLPLGRLGTFGVSI